MAMGMRRRENDAGDMELISPAPRSQRSNRDSLHDDTESEPTEDTPLRILFSPEKGDKKTGRVAPRGGRFSSWFRCHETLCSRVWWQKEVVYLPRTIPVGNSQPISVYAAESPDPGLAAALAIPNTVRNQKYRAATFVFQVLYEQFRFFFNLYFLLVALSQFIPALQVGFLFTYIAPLIFVLGITLLKEGYDDYQRYRRDKEANSQRYERLTPIGLRESVPSSDLRVGDLVFVNAGERVPADMILLRTSDQSGSVFIRTDQLDGETDWKLRRAVAVSQGLESEAAVLDLRLSVYCDKPGKEIDRFVGNLTVLVGADGQSASGDETERVEPLTVDNTLWANTVVCGGHATGLVIYTGTETRVAMNADPPKSKVGKVDMEINTLAKMLFGLSFALAVVMVALKGITDAWLQTLVRFVILFSSIIPISLRVNIDMAKTAFSYFMMTDDEIPGTIVRSSFIPEELGRIEYLLSDKTGTLTQNQMEMKEVHLGEVSFGREAMSEVKLLLAKSLLEDDPASMRRSMQLRVRLLIEALAVCHNVNVTDEDGAAVYQASSPDEVALVYFAKSMGMELRARSTEMIELQLPGGKHQRYEVLNLFPFTSETKRMGIIVRHETGRILLMMKGADAVMGQIVEFSDWLDEETGNLARKGLRTLVVGMKELSSEEYSSFSVRYEAAKRSLQDREQSMRSAVEELECNLELLGLTGVEDKLQERVSTTLETLRNAGVRVWMLTGDKVETATCIAISSRLFARGATIFHLSASTKAEAEEQFARFQKKTGACLVIDGRSLALCTDNFPRQFIEVACDCPSVVCCRCAPTQKALMVRLLKRHANKRCAAIGDGGNDVAMIQAADVGVGIEGKEGRQASLAADFSITKFMHVARLMLWHGRNSYTRTARLSQFVIHRGLIISIIQVVFSAIFYFATIAIYSGWLVVGYSTVYTMFPVFSLILDEDVDAETAFMYPELYQELQKGRRLCTRTFLEWVFKSIYQGAVIMLLSIFMFDDSFLRIISITFTSLILTELLMVALEIQRWSCVMVLAQLLSLASYLVSFFLLPTYFDVGFIFTSSFWLKVIVITLVSCLPVSIGKWLQRRCSPPTYLKIARSRDGYDAGFGGGFGGRI